MALETDQSLNQATNAKIMSERLHGNVYEVPDHLKKWFSYNGNKIYAKGREKYLSGNVVTWDELQNGQNSYRDDSYHQSMYDELSNSVYRERFNAKGNLNVVSEIYHNAFQLPEHLQQWVNQNGFRIDGQQGNADGLIAATEVLSFDTSNLYANDQSMHREIKQFICDHSMAKKDVQDFTLEFANDPQQTLKWFLRHKIEIDQDDDDAISEDELINYATKTKLADSDKKMTVGLINNFSLFAKMTGSESHITSADINIGVKLALHQITPAQRALDKTIEATKIGALAGGITGGGLALYKSMVLAGGVYSSWGSIGAGTAATCAGLTTSGILAGAVLGATAVGGVAYGINYYKVNDWYQKRTSELREAHLMK